MLSQKFLKFLRKFQNQPPQDFAHVAGNKVMKSQPVWGILLRVTNYKPPSYQKRFGKILRKHFFSKKEFDLLACFVPQMKGENM